MADQFNTGVRQVVGQGDSPVRGVEDNTTANAIKGFGGVAANGARSIFNAVIKGGALERKVRQGQALGDIISQSQKVVNAHKSGIISKTAMMDRLSKIRDEGVQQNPLIAKDIYTELRGFFGSNGLGHAAIAGTQEEQNTEALFQDALKVGMGHIGETGDEKKDTISSYLTWKESQRQLADAVAKIGYDNDKLSKVSKNLSIDKSRVTLDIDKTNLQIAGLNRDKALQQHTARQAIISGAKEAQRHANKFISHIMTGTATPGSTPIDWSTRSPEERQQAIHQLQANLASFDQVQNAAGLGASATLINQVTNPIKEQYEAAISLVKGTVTAKQYQQDIGELQNKSMLSLLHSASPSIRKAIAESKLLTGANPLVASTLNADIIRRLSGGEATPDPTSTKTANPVPSKTGSPEEAEDNKQYFKLLGGYANEAAAGTLDKDKTQALLNSVSNAMHGLTLHGQQADSPADFNAIMKFLADPSVHGVVVKNYDRLHLTASGAADVVKQNYLDVIEPKVRHEWLQEIGFAKGGKQVVAGYTITGHPIKATQLNTGPLSHLLKPTFSGGGVVFTATDPRNQKFADRLNRELSPVLNRAIRATATIYGTDNYRKIYEEKFVTWFQIEPKQKEGGE